MKAIIVVDMQNDFITGSLPVPGAQEIVGPIQEYLQSLEREGERRDAVFLTRCWHPTNHCSFVENGGKWPAHCVAGTHGARIQPGLMAMYNWYRDYTIISKGREAKEEQYSAMTPALVDMLLDRHVNRLELCGLARDYCVAATHDDAVRLGFEVTILEQLCRSVGK